MQQDIPQMLRKALAAYRSGKKSEAHKILMQVVDLDDKNEQAWLYLSLVVDSLEDQQICLENVLAINPSNQQAQKALNVVKQKRGIASGPPPPGSSTSNASDWDRPSTPDWDSMGWDDEPASSGSTWGDVMSGSPSPAPDPFDTPTPPTTPPTGQSTGWFDDDEDSPWSTTSNDPAISGGSVDSIPTSVEWNRGDSAPAAHGSGLNVEQPTGDQYDDWISNMGLGSNSDGSTMPATSSAFGEASGDVFGDIGGPAWDSDDTDSGWGKKDDILGDIPTAPTPSAAPDDDVSPLFAEAGQGSPLLSQSSSAPAAPPAPAVEEEDDDFFNVDLFDDDDEDEDTPPVKKRASEYFAEIPDDIELPPEPETEEEGEQSGGSLLTVLLLLLLNVGAVVGVALQA